MKTILVVDDDTLIREICTDVLTGADYRVFCAGNAVEGLDILRKEQINVVLLDVVMPVESGLGMIPKINNISPDSAVIIMTAFASLDSAIEAIRRGAYDFIKKPLQKDELLYAIRRAVDRQALLMAENRSLVQEREERLTRLELFRKVSQAVSSTLDLPEVLKSIMEITKTVIGAEACSVLLFDEASGELVFTVALGKSGQEVKKYRIRPGQGIAGWVFEHKEPLLVSDVKQDKRFYLGVDKKTGFESRSIIAVPLFAKERILGVIEVINKADNDLFNAEDRDILTTISGPIAVAIDHARMTDDLRRSFDIQTITNKLLSVSMEDLSLEEMLGRIIDRIVSIPWLSLESIGGIFLLEDPGVLVLKGHRGFSRHMLDTCGRVPLGKCICGRTALSGEIEFADSVDERHEIRHGGMAPHGHYCVPIKYSGRILGVITLYIREGHRRVKREAEFLLSIADIVAGIVRLKHAEEELRQSEDKFHKISSSAQDAIIMLDGDGKISYWNPASERIFGYTCEEAVGIELHNLLIPPIHSKDFKRGFEKFRKSGEGIVLGKTMVLTALKKDSTEFPVEVSISAVKIGAGWNSIGIVRDITERKRFEETIREMAYHDHLTGLPNRLLLFDRFNQALARGRRHKLLATFIFLDLDRFKVINDTLGHPIGDELLKLVAERLKMCIREADTVARFGGDEFSVLVPDIKDVEGVTKVVENIFATFNKSFNVAGHELFVTASMGVSVYPADGDDAETLFKNADIAMYRAKHEGRNNFQLYTPAMNVRAIERLKLENMLRKAVERKEFLLHYQPQVDINTGEVIGIEALVRWQEPERGLIPPMEFIPLAEHTGLIVPIGEWVLRTACAQNKAWQDKGLKPVRIAANLSMLQFKRKNFAATITGILEETGLDPKYMELELTESIIMEDAETTIEILRKLKTMGVRLVIDDFGTGYSSLQYLKKMPIDMLKIDRSFIRDITDNPDDAAISTAIIGVAHSLEIEVIAEGVETMEQLKFLKTLRCDNIQGFLISRPIPVEDVEGFLKKEIVDIGKKQGKGRRRNKN